MCLYRSRVVVVVSVLRVRRLRAGFALKVFALCGVRLRAERRALLEEVWHVSDLKKQKKRECQIRAFKVKIINCCVKHLNRKQGREQGRWHLLDSNQGHCDYTRPQRRPLKLTNCCGHIHVLIQLNIWGFTLQCLCIWLHCQMYYSFRIRCFNTTKSHKKTA